MYNNCILENYTYILGATSEIGKELIKLKLDRYNRNLCLLTTNPSRLETYVEELGMARSSKIKVVDYNLSNSDQTVAKLLKLREDFPPRRIFVMVGYLGNRNGDNSDEEISKIFNVNVNYLCKIFDSLYEADYFEDIESIHFSSSVGADLFYKRLFDYYESKRLLNEYLQSLRTKTSNVFIQTMKIGPVFDTEMGPSTGIFKLVASSKSAIAKNIIKGINGDEEEYIPKIWKLIINLYKLTPNFIQEKLKKII
jgi:short-subunit dehydrogenase